MTASPLESLLASVTPVNPDRERAARARLDELAKPPGSLGDLEEIAARLAAISGLPPPPLRRRSILVFGADHGVAARGVSAYPAEVTALVLRAVAEGTAAVSVMARTVGAEVVAVDMGTRRPVDADGILSIRVAAGTADLASGPALSRERAVRALEAGFELGRRVAERSDAVGLGEVGIGNTTAAAALAVALTGISLERAVGPGTGVSGETLARKRRIVAAAARRVDPGDPLSVLCEVGGLEIAGLAGASLGVAAVGRPVVLDGYVSTAAGLVAARLQPRLGGYLFASHRSAEPGHTDLLAALELCPALDLRMRLGEGTGAALAFPVLEAAAAILREMATLDAVLSKVAVGARER